MSSRFRCKSEVRKTVSHEVYYIIVPLLNIFFDNKIKTYFHGMLISLLIQYNRIGYRIVSRETIHIFEVI